MSSRPASSRARDLFSAWAPPLILLLLAALGWQLAVRIHHTPAWMLPAPDRIASSLVHDRSLLLHHAWITLREVLVGALIALVAGVACAIAIDSVRAVDRALYPIIVASQAVPIVALAPLLLIWFGYGMLPKVIVTALVAFFPIVVTTVDGLRSTDREVIELLRSMGANRYRRFVLARAPSALPGLFSGARIGAAIAVIGAVFGEYVGSKGGLGYLMNISSARLLTARVFACIVVLSVMSISLFALVTLIERILLPWRRRTITYREH